MLHYLFSVAFFDFLCILAIFILPLRLLAAISKDVFSWFHSHCATFVLGMLIVQLVFWAYRHAIFVCFHSLIGRPYTLVQDEQNSTSPSGWSFLVFVQKWF